MNHFCYKIVLQDGVDGDDALMINYQLATLRDLIM